MPPENEFDIFSPIDDLEETEEYTALSDPYKISAAPIYDPKAENPADYARRLQSEVSKKRQAQIDILKLIKKEDGSVDPQQAFAAMALTILPTVAGYYIGKARGEPSLGLAAGAKAGASAGTGYLGNIEAQRKEDKSLLGAQYKLLGEEAKEEQQQLGQMQMQRMRGEQQEDLAGIRAGYQGEIERLKAGLQANQPTSAMKEAQALMAQDSSLTLEQALAMRQSGNVAVDYQPIGEEGAKQYLDMFGVQISPNTMRKDARDMVRQTLINQRLDISETGKNERQQKGMDYKTSSSIIPGFKQIPNTVPNQKAVNNLVEYKQGMSVLMPTLDELESEIARNGMKYFDTAGAKQKVLGALSVKGIREVFGTGVSLSPAENEQISKALPAGANDPNFASALWSYISQGSKEGALVKIQTLKRLFNVGLMAIAADAGQYDDSHPEWYSPNTINQLKSVGVEIPIVKSRLEQLREKRALELQSQ